MTDTYWYEFASGVSSLESLGVSAGNSNAKLNGSGKVYIPCPNTSNHTHGDKTMSAWVRQEGNKVLSFCGKCGRSVNEELRGRGLLVINRPEQEKIDNKDYDLCAVDPSKRRKSFIYKRKGDLYKVYDYLTTDRKLLGHKVRYNKPDGGKTFMLYCYGRNKDSGKIDSLYGSFGAAIYGAELLVEFPDDDVLIVEGEKTVNAGREHYPDRVVITFTGNPTEIDWSILGDRIPLCLPDADRDGKSTNTLIKLCQHLGRGNVVKLPERLPDKWDVADPLPESLDNYRTLLGLGVDYRELKEERERTEKAKIGDVIEEMNAQFSLYQLRSELAVLNKFATKEYIISNQLGTRIITMPWATTLNLTGFDTNQRNKPRVQVGEKERKRSEFWLDHPDRSEISGVTFFPGALPADNTQYNQWTGLAPAIHTHGSCEKFLERQSLIFGGGDRCNWVLNWNSYLIQRPDLKAGTALIIWGEPGVGKTIQMEILSLYFVPGRHYVKATHQEHIFGRFNDFQRYNLVLHIDEGFDTNDEQQIATLKALVTDIPQLAEGKYIASEPINNYTHVGMTSNNQHVLRIEPGDRRFQVFNVVDEWSETSFGDEEKKHQRREVWAPIIEELQNGGADAYFRMLKDRDWKTGGVDPRELIDTPERQRMKVYSYKPVHAFLKEVIENGTFFNTGQIQRQFLRDQYIKFCDSEGIPKKDRHINDLA